ncbi:MAG: DUF4405 domain-containing protein [Sedimentisphaerales bacterium]|nr:DUF4405 domain-containing protein [Sedimentisphaerales bacterium]
MAKKTEKTSNEQANKAAKESTPFHKRKFVSLLTAFSFVLMTITGLGLFFAPSCRIARDTSWVLWGHSKEQFEAVHVWFSTVFLVAAGFHIYFNWSAIKSYFKTKIGRNIGLRTEWVAALLICLVVYVGTIHAAWPFKSLIDWQDTYKHGLSTDRTEHAGQGRRGGRNSLLQSDSEPQPQGTNRPKTRDIEDIDTLQAGRGRAGEGRGQTTNVARRGMGRMTLNEFCISEGIELNATIARLRDKGFTADAEMTMREIADRAGIHPSQMREILELEGDCDNEQ